MDLEFGCVIFDNPKDPGPGWAAQAGKKAVRIQDIAQLPNDVMWWTNASYGTFYGGTDIWRNPNLKHDKYLVLSPTDMMREWGRDPASPLHNNELTARIAANSFRRIMRLSWLLVREVSPRARIQEVFTGKTLREDLRDLVPDLDYPKGEAAVVMRSGSAWEEFTATISRQKKGSKHFLLRRPRVSYAFEMLQTPVPKGPFEFMGRKAMSAVGDTTRWAVHHDKPLMSEVKVRSIDPRIAPIYGFGNAINKNQRMPRSWVAHPELIALSSYADIEVKNVWSGDTYWAMLPEFPDPVRRFLANPYSPVSFSAGVVAETLWRAVALREDGDAKNMSPGEEMAMTSWPGVWIRACDKTSMLGDALRLFECGHTVISYGLGWVRCSVLEQDVETLFRDALDLGLLPQMCDIPEGMFSASDSPWGGDEKTRYYAKFMLVRNQDLLWELDQVPLMADEAQQTQYIRTIMAKHKPPRAA